MSLRKNILANYASQIYVTLIGIVMVPFYVRYMGAEAYGLVGFFTMMQAWFQLLDMGLSPTLARETARFNGGATDALSLRRLLRALEGIFISIAVLGASVMIAGSGAIATQWLKVQKLPLAEVKHAVMLMALIVALRWISGLYRGAINGFERLVWLSGMNATIATARFVVVIPLFIFLGTDATIFFGYQLVLAIVEVVTLVAKTYRLLPPVKDNERTPWKWAPLSGVLKFSLSIAFTSAVWVVVTQTDKLVLSKLLPLADYAYYSLAVQVANGVLIISGPVSAAILPRMAMLVAQGDDPGLIKLYRNATQFVAAIAVPVSLMLAFFSHQLLWMWTGNPVIADKAAPILTLYGLGNGILALSAFPYYLQYSKGDLKLHLIGNALFVLWLLPTLIWATVHYGVTGAGCAWIGSNSLYFLCWIPLVHKRFAAGLHVKWLLRDVGIIAVLALATVTLAQHFAAWPQGRFAVAVELCVLGLATLGIAVAGSSWGQKKIGVAWRGLLLQRLNNERT